MTPSDNDDAVALRRVSWRCRRGMRELDDLLLRHLEHAWATESDADRGTFLRLLDCEDDRLWRWFLGYATPDDPALADLVERIRQHPP